MTEEFLEYLKDLQLRVVIGDHQHTASPRYWGLKDYYWDIAPDNGYELTGATGKTRQVIWDAEGVHTYTVEEFIKDVEDELREEWITNAHSEYARKELPSAIDDVCEVDSDGYIDEDYWNRLMSITESSFELMEEAEVIRPVEGPMFLTKEEAQMHIQLNHYHYTSRVFTYGYHAWRSPDFEKLMHYIATEEFSHDTGCEHCKGLSPIDLVEKDWFSGHSTTALRMKLNDTGNLTAVYDAYSGDSSFDAEANFNFCPMCGKKLGGSANE